MLRSEDVKAELKKCKLSRGEVCKKLNMKYQTFNGKINGFSTFSILELKEIEKIINEYSNKFLYDFNEKFFFKIDKQPIVCDIEGIDTFIDTENGFMICSTYLINASYIGEIELTINHDVCMGSWTIGYDPYILLGRIDITDVTTINQQWEDKKVRLDDIEPKRLEDKILQNIIKYIVAYRFTTEEAIYFARKRYQKFDPENWNKIEMKDSIDFSKCNKQFGKTGNKGDSERFTVKK